MTLETFGAALKSADPSLVYELAAPVGLKRYAVWHQYGRSSTSGDDRNQMDFPKVQIDIFTNVLNDTLVDDISSVLWTLDLPYEVVSEGYDDEYSAYRTILQLVVI